MEILAELRILDPTVKLVREPKALHNLNDKVLILHVKSLYNVDLDSHMTSTEAVVQTINCF